ncbi:MAG: hypothetical protein OXG09_10760 [Chloroflexi bacterium]|nr:hypothetical protein [Chloroflexota bacterium]
MAKKKLRIVDQGWELIDKCLKIRQHDFQKEPLFITSQQVKYYTRGLEPRILAYQIARESRPLLFQELGLFLLPVSNRKYAILRGEGYQDLPEISGEPEVYYPSLNFPLESAKFEMQEMQFLDFAYATSLLRSYMNDDSLLLTIRGRKHLTRIKFKAGGHNITAESAITEVDAGYEGRNQIVLLEAKADKFQNFNVRQLYYPYRLWHDVTNKNVHLFFFSTSEGVYSFWKIKFEDPCNFHSIKIEKKAKFRISDDVT